MPSQESTSKPLLVAQQPGSVVPSNGAPSNGVPALADSAYLRSGYYSPGAVPPPEAGGAPPGGPTFTGLARAFKRRWILALGAAACGAILAIGAVFTLLPPGYRTSVWISIAKVENQDVVKAQQAGLVKSPLVFKEALNQKASSGVLVKDLAMVRGQPDPVGWLEGALKVEFPSPEAMRVSLVGDRADETADLLNAIAEALIKVNEQRDGTLRLKRIEQLKESKTGLDAEISKQQAGFDFRFKAHREINPENALKKAEEDYKDASKAHQDNERKLREARGRLVLQKNRVENMDKLPIDPDRLNERMRTDPRAGAPFKRLKEIPEEIEEYKRVAPVDLARSMSAKLEAEREHHLKAIAALRERLRPELEEDIRAAELSRSRSLILDLEQEIQILGQDTRELKLEAGKAEQNLTKVQVNPLPPDLKNLQENIVSLKKVREEMATTITRMEKGVDRDPSLAPVSIQSPALAPAGKDTSRQIKIAGAGGLGLFCLLLFGVTYMEFRSRKIGEADEVAATGMNLVGTLPLLPAHARGPVSTGTSPKDVFWQNRLSESIDGIRTLLLHMSRTDAVRVLMVTSAAGGEGKTSLASQLAASLARAWRKVLLIDGDLRHPAAHGLFNLPLEPGFSEVLRGEVKPADAIKPTPLSRLWMMPAGHWDSHAVQALAQDSVRGLFEQLKQQYDFIIVDACPVLPVADSLVLGQHVDGVLFSVLRDVSRLPALHAAHQKMTNLGIRTLGAVVIGTDTDLGAAGYKYAAVAAS